MELNTKEMLKKKILDAQEMVRDYEMYSKKVEDKELVQTFKSFAEDCGLQARALQDILKRMN
ncbi:MULTISPECIES: hypothetical protein [Tissierellales]|jgi:rubrerythrin|uniref:Uncharacterized protein n=1 Tax=Acidilutibacter cellobiosedens TaxID=2507161 RepID=A0A410QEF1_9FIRM|nr:MULTISPECIES: hypothetical protein [Tissierellales]MBE6083561.1 hypothetical protein [Tissierellaceae bacterium]QAT62299.1 hypothetical protein EQM13_12375 [Acidilutibacter cellobiosedens]SCL96894.1 hypothetical protein PP176A_3128 [Sporanaerobacter sp. PP17-6a]